MMLWLLLYSLGAAYWVASWGQVWADAERGSDLSRHAVRRMLLVPVWPYAALWLVTHPIGSER